MNTESKKIFCPTLLEEVLRDRGAKGRAAVLKLISTFLSETPDRLKRIREATDTHAAFETLHTLKSGCGFIGAQRMFLLCQTLEESTTALEGSDVDRLALEYETVERELRVYHDSLASLSAID
jgi:HPt (histidine-containing phosphotransfer) domain-containing protein